MTSPTIRRIGWLHFWNDFTLDFLTPLLPAGIGAAWVGLMEGLADAAGQLLRIVSGRESDRSGKRVPWVRAGYLINASARPLVSIGLWFAWPLWVVLFRVLDRVGKGIRGSATDALVADWAPIEDRGKAFTLMRVMDHWGATLGALCAAGVAFFFPDFIHWAVLLLVAPALGVLWLCGRITEAPHVQITTDVRAPAISVSADGPGWWPRSRSLQRPLLAVALASIGLRLSPLLVLVRVSGTGEDAWPLWMACLAWAALGVVQALSASLAGTLLGRYSVSLVLRGGWWLGALVFAGLALAPGAWLPWVGLGWAVLAGATEGVEKTWLSGLAHSEERALTFGAFALVSALGALLGSGLVGFFLVSSAGLICLFPAAGLVAGAILTSRTSLNSENGL